MTESRPVSGSAELFDELAGVYDDVGVEFFGPIAAGLADALAPARGEWVADLGCGKGAFLLRAAERVGESGRAVGIDLSPRMVEHANRGVRAHGFEHAEVLVGDAGRPQLPAEAFDVVGASLVLFFLPDAAEALVEWFRLLAPGGRVGISTFGPIDEVWRDVEDVFTPYLPPTALDARTSAARSPFATDQGVEALLAGAGFTDVTTLLRDLPVRFADAQRWYAFSMSTGQRALWRLVPAQAQRRVREEAERRLARARQPDGSFVLHQQVRYTVGLRPLRPSGPHLIVS